MIVLFPPSLLGAVLLGLTLLLPRPLAAQVQPTVDTIIVTTENLFDHEEARANAVFRLANAIRITTRPWVVRREILLRAGEPYSAAAAAETRRNLRRLGIFRDVIVDTLRLGDSLAVHVRTFDGWTTRLDVGASSTGGTFTWAAGLWEENFLGRAMVVGAGYRQEPDRNALSGRLRIPRVGSTRVRTELLYEKLSDGRQGVFWIGVPFRAYGDRIGMDYEVRGLNRRVLQFRDGELFEEYRRTGLIQRATVAVAPIAGAGGYLRAGLQAQLRSEAYVTTADTALAPSDTLSGSVGAFGEWFVPRFKVVQRFGGFSRDEDIDLSARLRLGIWAAPSAFGYERGGVGPVVEAQVGFDAGPLFGRIIGVAQGLMTPAGVDSGQVQVRLAIGVLALPRQSTMLMVDAGIQKNPPPGLEFDLGHGKGPRAFGPHAFTGTRAAWGTLEHRVVVADELLGVLGLAVAGFVDYGGAWFPDQPARAGGNVGWGLRLGPTRATGQNVIRFDLARRFGDGPAGRGWVFSFGSGVPF